MVRTKSGLAPSAIALSATVILSTLGANVANAGGTLRIGMTSTDIPTTTGAPDNGFEGLRFLGFPVYDSLVLWDLSHADKPAAIRPGLASRWEQKPDDSNVWTFHLQQGVKFHDGSAFNADSVIWNFDRYFDKNSKQFDAQGSAVNSRRLAGILSSWRKVDDYTVEFKTLRPVSYFPVLLSYIGISSPAQYTKVGSWQEFAKSPSGTGPFKITEVKPRVSVTMVRNADYWDKTRVPKLDRMILLPIPEPSARVAAIRSGQVDWIEAPPPDSVPSLKSAGLTITTGTYPHVWPWILNLAKPNSPWADIRVRHAINYCADRDGLVKLVNGLAEPSVGIFRKSDPRYGSPTEKYSFDVAKAKALMAEAGYSPSNPLKIRVAISNSGSGQMVPLQMNEFIQQSVKQCGFDVSFEVMEWGTMLTTFRTPPTNPPAVNFDALNVSAPPETDLSAMSTFTRPSSVPPAGLGWSGWKNAEYDQLFDKIEKSTDQKEIDASVARAHQIFVDMAPWAFFVHDLNPRAMNRKVKGFISPQSWFLDFSNVDMQ